MHNPKRIAINYMIKYMSPDEMQLITQTFYDFENNRFKSTGLIEVSDGRKAALEEHYVLYMASSISVSYTKFSYNLQPYSLAFLNKNLKEKNIIFDKSKTTYRLRK